MIVTFVKPSYLILLALVPLIILAHFYVLNRKRAFALKFANFEALARVKGIDLLSKNIVVLIIAILMIILLTFSLSGMILYRVLYSSSSSFVIAIDTSRSMEATDILPTRIDAAKEAALSFVDELPPGTRVGIVSFSGNAFIEQEITDDKSLISQAINRISLSTLGGTDLGNPIIVSSNLLNGEEVKSVILISDGQINVGTIDELINYANQNAVIVHTIGIGTEEGGETIFGLSKINKEVLQSIAYNTNGKFFDIGTRESLKQSFLDILDLRIKKVPVNLTLYFIFAALILYLIEYVLVNTRFRMLP
mgnify:CR=1 FL=1